MGQKKIILPGVLEAADTELAALIQGYSDAEICYYDESRIQINFAGHFSLMPRFWWWNRYAVFTRQKKKDRPATYVWLPSVVTTKIIIS